MDRQVTSSITVKSRDDFESFGEVISEYMEKLALHDIQPLPDYGNIIMDSSEQSILELMDIMRKERPNIYWQIIISEGEHISYIYSFDQRGFSKEHIGKTLEEIAQGGDYTCSHENCSDCASRSSCHSHEHDESCTCECCSHENFDLESTLEMIDNTAHTDEGNDFFDTLTRAYTDELTSFIHSQTPEDEADEAYDIFFNTLTQVIIYAAACDGTYTQTEHNLIERIAGELDFERVKAALPNITADKMFCIKSMEYWHEAESFDCDVRRLVIMLCAFVCCIDAPLNDDEYDFIKKLSLA